MDWIIQEISILMSKGHPAQIFTETSGIATDAWLKALEEKVLQQRRTTPPAVVAEQMEYTDGEGVRLEVCFLLNKFSFIHFRLHWPPSAPDWSTIQTQTGNLWIPPHRFRRWIIPTENRQEEGRRFVIFYIHNFQE